MKIDQKENLCNTMITDFMRPKFQSSYTKKGKGKLRKTADPERDWIATEKKYHKLVRTQKFKNLSPAQQNKKASWVLNHPVMLKKAKKQKKGWKRVFRQRKV